MKTKDVVKFLNECYESDPETIRQLFETRIVCNEKLVEKLNGRVLSDFAGNPTASLLGILNALLENFEKTDTLVGIKYSAEDKFQEFVEVPREGENVRLVYPDFDPFARLKGLMDSFKQGRKKDKKNKNKK
jgi:hypothetical protein